MVVLAVAVGGIGTSALTDAMRIPQTPSDWLLARYDRVIRRAYGPQGDSRRIRHDRGSNFDRRIFDLIDDHPGSECDAMYEDCPCRSGSASWPDPALGDDLDTYATLVLFEQSA
jgi:hypothetical protein